MEKTGTVQLGLMLACFLVLCSPHTGLGLDAQEKGQQLVIRHGKSGEIGWTGEVENGEEFSIRYIHSVDKLPVFEFYTNKDGQLFLTGIKVIDFGAGLDYTGEGDLRMEGKWTYIDNIHREIDSLPLRVGSVADHTLLYRGRKIHLRDHFSAYTLVHVEIQ